MRHLLALFLLLGAALPVRAAEDSIHVEHAWSRAAAAGRVGVLYLTVTDTGAADRLVGVDTEIADKAELHESLSENGVMKMRPVQSVPVKPGEPTVLKPGGYHVMLMGLRRELRDGDSFPVTLHFASGGAVTTTANVSKAGAAMPDAMGADHHAMQH